MSNIDLTKYGITGVKEIVYNPSYEQLFADEMDPALRALTRVSSPSWTPSTL